MELLHQSPELSVSEIAKKIGVNFKTIADHAQKLVQCGLVDKKYYGRAVSHTISPYGKKFLSFIKTFWHSAECQNVGKLEC